MRFCDFIMRFCDLECVFCGYVVKRCRWCRLIVEKELGRLNDLIGATTLSLTMLNIATLSLTTLNIATLNSKNVAFGRNTLVMLTVGVLSAFMLSVIIPNVY